MVVLSLLRSSHHNDTRQSRGEIVNLDDIANLPENWDSYGAKPIGADVIAKVKATFPVLPPGWWDCVPCSSGGIQLEQHADGWDIEISIERATSNTEGK
jgi:hypothetical protein